MTNDKKVPVTLTLRGRIKERLDRFSAKTRRSRGEYVEWALLAQFGRDETIVRDLKEPEPQTLEPGTTQVL